MRILNVSLVLIVTLFSMSFGFDLKCVEDYHREYTCAAYDLVITSPDDTITSVNGKTDPSSLYYDTLQIQNQKVNYMPRNISRFFPKLEELEIFNSSLQWIEQENIKELTFLKVINLAHNNLAILEEGLFHFNRNLETINIRQNQLNLIHRDIFYELTNLRVIKLEYNRCTGLFNFYYSNNNAYYYHDEIQIELSQYCQSWGDAIKTYKSQMNEIINDLKSEQDRTTLDLTHRLETCDENFDAALSNFRHQKLLNSNTMEFISEPNDSLLMHLQCGSVEVGLVCTVVDFKVSFANLSIEIENFNDSAVTWLHIHQQPILFLPQNLAEKFPQLNQLSVIECGLCELEYSVFEGLDLLNLNLTKNKIPEVPLDTFTELENLQELDLSFNKIHRLHDDVFVSLKKLQKLYLNNNFLSVINVEVVKNLENLNELLLQDNQLKFIGASLLTPMASLKSVDLSNNVCINMIYPTTSLMDIEATIIGNCIAPVELICKTDRNESSETVGSDDNYCYVQGLLIKYPKTKISELIGGGVGGLNNSVKVFFSDNQSLKFFPFQLSQQWPNLERIEIQRSNLTTLHQMDFEGFLKLTEIVINQNNLSSLISQGTFDPIPQLELLDLSSNNIAALPTKIFAKLTRLHTLLLSNNRIVRFTADFLPRKNSIDIFRVDANQLEFIETKTIRFLRKAKLIDLTGNICINMKFAKTENSTRALVELSGEIDLNCSVDDYYL